MRISDWSSDVCSSDLEHTHAGRVLALRDLVTPARAPKRDEGSRVVDTAAIVGDVEARAALMIAHMNFDPSSAREAGILEQRVEDIGDRPVEQARYLRDEFIAERWTTLDGMSAARN